MCWDIDPHQQQPLKAGLGLGPRPLALSAQVVSLCGKFSKIYLSWVIIREHPNFFL